MTNPFSEKDIVVESVKQIGETLRSIISKLSGQYVLLFGIAVLIIAAITGSYIATLDSPIHEIRWLPYVLLGTGIAIIILWFIGNKISKSLTASHSMNSTSEKYGISLRKRLRFLDEITDDSDADELQKASDDLVKFIENLPQGDYYAKEIKKLTRLTSGIFSNSFTNKELDEYHKGLKRNHKEYRQRLVESRSQIYDLIDEFLKTQ